jgi:hypothetical protein
MTGLIWFVQIVHYPLLRILGCAEADNYHRTHMHRTGWIVGPVMLTEAITALYFYRVPYPGTPLSYWLAGLALVGVIWLSTIGLQAPAHVSLLKEYDEGEIDWLIRTNWIRTISWSLRTVILSLLLVHHFFGGSHP